MYAGRKVEQALPGDLFNDPLHPYTRGLLAAASPRLKSDYSYRDGPPDGDSRFNRLGGGGSRAVRSARAAARPEQAVAMVYRRYLRRLNAVWSRARSHLSPRSDPMSLLSVSELKTHYRSRDGLLRAVDGVDLVSNMADRRSGRRERLRQVDTRKTLLRLVDPTSGRIEFKGRDITVLDQRQLRSVRKSIQMIFQDPFASLNPRHTVGEILEAPLIVHEVGNKTQRREIVAQIISKVGLPSDSINRYPHEFSGGQRQRIGIARALLLNPELVVCDEPRIGARSFDSGADLNLLVEMKKEFGLSYIFISHDLSVVRYFADRVMVMYLGASSKVQTIRPFGPIRAIPIRGP